MLSCFVKEGLVIRLTLLCQSDRICRKKGGEKARSASQSVLSPTKELPRSAKWPYGVSMALWFCAYRGKSKKILTDICLYLKLLTI